MYSIKIKNLDPVFSLVDPKRLPKRFFEDCQTDAFGTPLYGILIEEEVILNINLEELV